MPFLRSGFTSREVIAPSGSARMLFVSGLAPAGGKGFAGADIGGAFAVPVIPRAFAKIDTPAAAPHHGIPRAVLLCRLFRLEAVYRCGRRCGERASRCNHPGKTYR